MKTAANEKGFGQIVLFILGITVIAGGIIGGAYYIKKINPTYDLLNKSSSDRQIDETTTLNTTINPQYQTNFILYNYRQNDYKTGKSTDRLFKSSIDGTNNTDLQLDYKDSQSNSLIYNYQSPKNSNFLIRSHSKRIDVASFEQVDNFKTVVQAESEDELLTKPIFSEDGSKFAYQRRKLSLVNNQSNTDIYIASIDGSQNKLVKSISSQSGIGIVKLNLRDERIYFLSTKDNNISVDLNFLDLKKGNSETLITGLKISPPSSLTSSTDFSRVFFIEDEKRIVEFDISNKNKKILYEKLQNDPNAHIIFSPTLMLAQNKGLLYFSQSSSSGTNSYSINLTDGQLTPLFRNTKYKGSIPLYMSPDERYIWFSSIPQLKPDASGYEIVSYYIYNTKTNQMNLFLADTVKDNESLHFVSWLSQ